MTPTLASVDKQIEEFFGGGALGVNVVERAPTNNHEASRPASTHTNTHKESHP